MNTIQEYTTSILFSLLGLLAFTFFIISTLFLHKCYLTYSYHLSEYTRYDAFVRGSSSELNQMRKDVELDHTADCLTKIRNAELIRAADDCDNGMRIALCAWEDIMDPAEEWKLDIESKGDKMVRGRRRSHGRWVIGLMRGKCREGMEKELQAMYNEVMSRKIDLQSNLFNRRVASGHEVKAERTVSVRMSPMRKSPRGSPRGSPQGVPRFVACAA